MTKKLREYDTIVRDLNQQLKKSNMAKEENRSSKENREGQLSKYKHQVKAYEEELYQKQQKVIEANAKIAKMQKKVNSKDGDLNRMQETLNGQTDTSEQYSKMRDQSSNIEVLEDMITGLKSQLKQKDLDQYRLKSKIVALQAEMESNNLEQTLRDDKYGCGKDHDRSGYQYGGGVDDDNVSVRSSTSNFSKTSRPAELTKTTGPKASGH